MTVSGRVSPSPKWGGEEAGSAASEIRHWSVYIGHNSAYMA